MIDNISNGHIFIQIYNDLGLFKMQMNGNVIVCVLRLMSVGFVIPLQHLSH